MGRLLFGLLLAIGSAAATAAPVIVDLGTAGRAKSFIDTTCAGKPLAAVQSGQGLTPAQGDGWSCGADDARLSESFTLPAGAFDITLTITGFSTTDGGMLLLNGDSVTLASDCDDGDCGREVTGVKAGSDTQGPGAIIDDLRPGSSYELAIRFRGFGSSDDRDQANQMAAATLVASLSYALPQVSLVPQSAAQLPAHPPAVPEPASTLLLPAGLALLALRRRWLRPRR